MDETVTYMGVECKNCRNKIAVQPHLQDEREVRFPTITGPIKVHCDQCGQTREYGPLDEIHFADRSPHQSD